jgi:hypothetical protein
MPRPVGDFLPAVMDSLESREVSRIRAEAEDFAGGDPVIANRGFARGIAEMKVRREPDNPVHKRTLKETDTAFKEYMAGEVSDIFRSPKPE